MSINRSLPIVVVALIGALALHAPIGTSALGVTAKKPA